jgi:hypothetical protein
VTIKNQATGAVVIAMSMTNGLDSAPQLSPAVYTVSSEARGFSTAVREDIEVRVADSLRVDVTLSVGDVNQTVDVKSAAPLLQTDAGQVISAMPRRKEV